MLLKSSELEKVINISEAEKIITFPEWQILLFTSQNIKKTFKNEAMLNVAFKKYDIDNLYFLENEGFGPDASWVVVDAIKTNDCLLQLEHWGGLTSYFDSKNNFKLTDQKFTK